MREQSDLAELRVPPSDELSATATEELDGNSGSSGWRMTVMVGLTLMASGINYLSNIVFGRMLTPASYGDFTALLALVIVVSIPTAAAQTVIAERIAVYRATGDEGSIKHLLRHALAHVGFYALILALIYSLAIPFVVSVLDLQAVGPAIALIPLIAVTFFLPVCMGILQGHERFVALGVAAIAVASARIVFGVPSTLAGGGAGGPVAGQAIGSILVAAAVLFYMRRMILGRGSGAAMSGIRRRIDGRAISAGSAFIAFALLSNLDVLLAKIFLSPVEAGSYAALATVGKMVLFLPAAVSVLMVPYVARHRVQTGSTFQALRVSAIGVALGSLLVAIPAAVEPSLVLRLMFGNRFVDAASGVLPIVFASTLLALLYLLVVYTVTIQDHRWTYLLLAGVGLQSAVISIFHGSPTEIALSQAGVMLTILVINELLFHPILRAERLLRREDMGPRSGEA